MFFIPLTGKLKEYIFAKEGKCGVNHEFYIRDGL